MRLWSVEGNHQRLDGGAMFGNAPRTLWQTWLPADAQHRVTLACRGLLAEGLGGKHVLFEAGIGAFFEPRLKERYGVLEPEHVLLASLAARGVRHEEIDAVVLSHLHFDHAGGLLAAWEEDRSRRLLFPRAKFLVGRAAFERARDPHPRDHASFITELPRLLEDSGRLELVTGERSALLGDAVRFRFSDGHTPGLMLAEIGGDGGILFCSDLMPGRAWVHLPVTMGFDRFPERLVEEKRAVLDDAIARGLRLYFAHDPAVALAVPVRDSFGRYRTSREEGSVEGITLPAGR
jgi:glyoxylase-like metal-dependent hydrolase (beta-lactamase superfamily II)